METKIGVRPRFPAQSWFAEAGAGGLGEEDVFAEDDLDEEFPIGKKTIFLCERHIDRFMDTIQYMRDRGFEIRSFYYD